MEPHLIVIACAFGIQLVCASCALMARVIPALDFYKLSAILMLLVTSAWGFAGSWNAVWTGGLAVLWMWLAATEPGRRMRHQSLLRQLRAMEEPRK